MPKRLPIKPESITAIGGAIVKRDRDALAAALEKAVDWRRVPRIGTVLGAVLEAADDVVAPVLADLILDAIDAAEAGRG